VNDFAGTGDELEATDRRGKLVRGIPNRKRDDVDRGFVELRKKAIHDEREIVR
jgi:hypothetical protein